MPPVRLTPPTQISLRCFRLLSPRERLHCNNLAAIHNARGQPDEAEKLHRRALAIKERLLGPDHPDTEAVRENFEDLRAAGEVGGTG